MVSQALTWEARGIVIGDKLANRIPVKLVHSVAPGIFAVPGVATLLYAGSGFGF
jgi:Ca2+/H+ antiporter, TMEM165/GDT1 family